MRTIGLVLLAVLPFSPSAFSQAAPAPAAQVITLGNSAVALTGPWKFQPGDSPIVNGAILWAQPAFDDSHWAPMDMASTHRAVDLITGLPDYVPGWTSRGYPDLSGFAWYRLRVRVSNPAQPLWLKMPPDYDNSFQVFANGQLIGHYGDFIGKHVTSYDAKPVAIPLPPPGPDGQIDLAMRFYLDPWTEFDNPDVGGLHSAPLLGLRSTIRLMQASDQDAILHSQFGAFLEGALLLLILPLAALAWLSNRHEPAWMWLFLALAWTGCSTLVVLISNLATLLSVTAAEFILIITLPFWIMFWWYWFGLRDMRWIPRAAWALAAAITLLAFLARASLFGMAFIPLSTLHWLNLASVWLSVPYQLLLIVILVEAFRRDRTEALLAAVPIILSMYGSFFTYLMVAFHIRGVFFPFGFGITFRTIVTVLLVLTIGVLALRRYLRNQVRDSLLRESEKKDLEQAQQLQQRVLVPDTLHAPAFTIQSEYRPALTVGGDFYQTISRPDGSLVLVIGDVSGKGISAAMLVAVLVGAIRSQAEHNADPSEMLAMLNRRMIGRAGGHFATCLAAQISPSGQMRIANAGHISPYRNGQELELEGSLPLGITDDIAYPTHTITLRPGDLLTFITDGVIEATNPSKELFGFDRTRDISSQPAAAIVESVLTFGQEDDITVLGVQFAPA